MGTRYPPPIAGRDGAEDVLKRVVEEEDVDDVDTYRGTAIRLRRVRTPARRGNHAK